MSGAKDLDALHFYRRTLSALPSSSSSTTGLLNAQKKARHKAGLRERLQSLALKAL
jgi:hypothetical protein